MTTVVEALRGMPPLIHHLRMSLEPGRAGTERRAPGYAKQAPLAIITLDHADDLYACLHEHAACVADVLGTKPPKAQCWAGRGIPTSMEPGTVLHHSEALARFLEHQLPMVSDTQLAGDIEVDIIRRYTKISTAHTLTPDPERVDARCKNCSKLNLYKHPPENPGDDETFRCHTCHCWHTETDVMERRAARERELKAKKRKGAA